MDWGHAFLCMPAGARRGHDMNLEKKRSFIINILYYGLMVLIVFVLLKYALPLLAPFVIGFVIAYLLKRPIRFVSVKLKANRKLVAIIMVLVFYCTIGLLLVLLSIKAFTAAGDFLQRVPSFYTWRVEPMLMNIFDGIEQSVLSMDESLVASLEDLWSNFVNSLGQIVSTLSGSAITVLSSLASSLPGLFVKLLLMIISTFFIAVDYDRIASFFVRQLSENAQTIFWEIKEYVTGTLFVCIRSYAIIMSITFVELSIGLSIIGVDNAIVIALLIAIFDILPVLGTGGIMIPWAVITAIQGDYSMAIALFAVYIVVTIIRNIIEPKIVGSQLGLHPVATLASLFVGAQLFGAVGLFGFPIGLSLLRYLNEQGTLKIFK